MKEFVENPFRDVERWLEVEKKADTHLEIDRIKLYGRLIHEESSELLDGLLLKNKLKIIDGCMDLIWVSVGFILNLRSLPDNITNKIEKQTLDRNMEWFLDTWNAKKYIGFGVFDSEFELIRVVYINFMPRFVRLLEHEGKLNNVNLEKFYRDAFEILFCCYNICRTEKFQHHKAWKELVRSNFSKFVEGKIVRDENFKIQKPDTFSPADFSPYIKGGT